MNATTPTPSRRIPKLRHHKGSGQGYVEIAGRSIYLGRFGEPETQAKYHQVIAEWLAGRIHAATPPEQITIVEVLSAYLEHAKRYYVSPSGKPTKELQQVRYAMRPLKKLYAKTRAADFGPLALKAVRVEMVKRGWCRRHVNQQTTRVKRIFRWAVENELVPGHVYHALQAVVGLRRGRTEAPESKAVRPVPQDRIEAVKPFVSQQVWAMIQLQLLTAARSGEIVIMRPCDIDRSGKVWFYTPSQHKTAWRGHERTIYLGPRAQQVVARFLLRPAEAYCFSPAEADAERRAAYHARRKTPMSCGNRPGTNRKDNPHKRPRETYTTASYARAISEALKRAFPPPGELAKKPDELWKEYEGRLTQEDSEKIKAWHKRHHWRPHQLRHNAATELRREFGLETARIILGHRSPAVTTIYAEADRQKAIQAIVQVG